VFDVVVSVAKVAMSVMKRWNSRDAVVVVSPIRQASTQGRVQSRGAPPPTMAAKSRSALGGFPGASAMIARPIRSTFGVAPDTHWVSALLAAVRPRMSARQTSSTRGLLSPWRTGQQ
jgi:hypothetical protein